jgi:hypothetical protein
VSIGVGARSIVVNGVSTNLALEAIEHSERSRVWVERFSELDARVPHPGVEFRLSKYSFGAFTKCRLKSVQQIRDDLNLRVSIHSLSVSRDR